MKKIKLFSKTHWDLITYNLLYPGFVGSMIYELIPNERKYLTREYFTDPLFIIKVLITLYYFLDYFHLYGDIEEKIKKENDQLKADKDPLLEKSGRYILCDLATCVLYFLSFVCVKYDEPGFAIGFVACVPIFFTWYKWKIKSERNFHLWFMGANLLSIPIYLLVQQNLDYFSNFPARFDLILLMIIIAGNLGVYAWYVFRYYEKHGVHSPAKDFV